MSGGRSAVNDPKIVRLLKENFVSVAYNGHLYKDHRRTPFAKKLALGGNRFVVATAAGRILAASGYGAGNADAILKGWEAWRSLPEAERKRGTPVETGEDPPLPRPPPGGIVLRAYTRCLKADGGGGYARITPEDLKSDPARYPRWRDIYREPMMDVVWLSESEGKSLVPQDPQPGTEHPLPDAVRRRIIRYHLRDGTRSGKGGSWELEDMRKEHLALEVQEVTGAFIRLRLRGSVLLEWQREVPASAGIAPKYDARLTGFLEYDVRKRAFTRFDLLAVGDYSGGWGDNGRINLGLRPGINPLGVAFELAPGDGVLDRVLPTMNFGRFGEEGSPYFHAEKP